MNNSFVYDPSRVEAQDLKHPGPGKYIRLKRSAYGQDVRTILQQLPMSDVTRGHMADLETFLQIGDVLSSVNDNIKGSKPRAAVKQPLKFALPANNLPTVSALTRNISVPTA